MTGYYGGSHCSDSDRNVAATNRVALLDELSLKYPNPDFLSNVTASAKAAGYGFDYYPPAAVTLDLLIHLPGRGYSMIILRTHGSIGLGDPPAFTTSESYSQSQRVSDQLLDRLTSINVDGFRLFAVLPEFVTKVMCGTFPGTLVLAMFCNSARVDYFPRAFVEKGARAYVGWNNFVTISESDLVLKALVKLLLEGNTLGGAVQTVMATVGADPFTGAELSYYPLNQSTTTFYTNR